MPIRDGVKGSTDDVFCRIESNVKNLTIRNIRGKCGAAAFTNISPDGDCFSMENVLLEDWIVEGCKVGIEIGGDATCSNFTVKNSVFSSMTDSDGTGIHLSGTGKTLKLNKLLFDNVNLKGFARGVKIGTDVQIEDMLEPVMEFTRVER